jgi:hypothetical protein
MIKNLYNKLPSANKEELIWKIDDIYLYNKHTQTFIEPENKSLVNKKVNNVPIVIPIKFINNTDKVTEKVTDKVTEKVTDKVKDKVTEKVKEKVTDKVTEKVKDKVTEKVKEKKQRNKTDNIIKPLDLILKETATFEDFKDAVKNKLVAFISTTEFNKVFGMTKCSEIMSGIVNNRWNKSIALFISFLFDKSINYNSNIITYNKEKCKEIIETIC